MSKELVEKQYQGWKEAIYMVLGRKNEELKLHEKKRYLCWEDGGSFYYL